MTSGGNLLELERTTRACPLCGSAPESGQPVYEERFDPERLDDFSFASRKVPEQMHWRLIECSGCALLFASPAPEAGAVAAGYREAAYDSAEEARHAAATYSGLVRELLPRLPPSGDALDVGAGDGAFLGVLRELGFEDLAGVEPSRAALDGAAAGLRPLIREGIFDAGDFEPGRFRLVSCLHVVDHMPDPLTALAGARELLCDGGALLVVCHDRHAPVNRLMGRRSPIYDVEHLQLFSHASLRALFERAGYRDIAVSRFANRYPLRYWLRLLPLGRRVKQRMAEALDGTGLGHLPLTLPVGNIAAVGWR